MVYDNSTGGNTSEVIQAGSTQTGNIWTVENNSGSTFWTVTSAGNLAGGKGTSLILSGATSGAVSLQPPASFTNFNFNLPAGAGSSGQVLTSGGGSSNPMTWTTLASSATTDTTNAGNISSGTLNAARLPNNTAVTWFGTNGTSATVSGTTSYMAAGVTSAGSTTIGNRQWVSPVACTLRNFYVYTLGGNGGGTLQFTIYDSTTAGSAGSATGLTVSFGSSVGAGVQSDTSHTASVNAGDLLTVQVTMSAGTSAPIGPWG